MVQSLEEMFVYQLQEMYHIEQRLVEVLGELAADANNDNLRRGFEDHRAETREHVERIEQVFEALDLRPERRQSKVLEALIEERADFYAETSSEELEDLFDIQAGMKTERLEMTGYQGLLTLAKKLGYGDDVTERLEDNLSSERSTFRELEGLSSGSKFKSMIGQLLE